MSKTFIVQAINELDSPANNHARLTAQRRQTPRKLAAKKLAVIPITYCDVANDLIGRLPPKLAAQLRFREQGHPVRQVRIFP